MTKIKQSNHTHAHLEGITIEGKLVIEKHGQSWLIIREFIDGAVELESRENAFKSRKRLVVETPEDVHYIVSFQGRLF